MENRKKICSNIHLTNCSHPLPRPREAMVTNKTSRDILAMIKFVNDRVGMKQDEVM